MSYTGGLEREREYSEDPEALRLPSQPPGETYYGELSSAIAYQAYLARKARRARRESGWRRILGFVDSKVQEARSYVEEHLFRPAEKRLQGVYEGSRGRGGFHEAEAFGAAFGLSALYFGRGVVEGLTGIVNPMDYYRTYKTLRNPSPLLDELRNNPLSWSELAGSVVGGYVGGKALGAGVSKLLPDRYYAEVAEPYRPPSEEARGLFSGDEARLTYTREAPVVYRVYRASKPEAYRGVELASGGEGLRGEAWELWTTRVEGEELPVRGRVYSLRSGLGYKEVARAELEPGELRVERFSSRPGVVEAEALRRSVEDYRVEDEFVAVRRGRAPRVERIPELGEARRYGFRVKPPGEPRPPSEENAPSIEDFLPRVEGQGPRPPREVEKPVGRGSLLLEERGAEEPRVRLGSRELGRLAGVEVGRPGRMIVRFWSESRSIRGLGALGVVGLGSMRRASKPSVLPVSLSLPKGGVGSRGRVKGRGMLGEFEVLRSKVRARNLVLGALGEPSPPRPPRISAPRIPARFRAPIVLQGRRRRGLRGRRYSEILYPVPSLRRIVLG